MSNPLVVNDQPEIREDDDGNQVVVKADYDRLRHIAARALRDIAEADSENRGGSRVRLLKKRAQKALRDLGEDA